MNWGIYNYADAHIRRICKRNEEDYVGIRLGIENIENDITAGSFICDDPYGPTYKLHSVDIKISAGKFMLLYEVEEGRLDYFEIVALIPLTGRARMLSETEASKKYVELKYE